MAFSCHAILFKMSLEAYRPQPQPVEVSHPTTSPHMEQVVTTLATAHGIDLTQVGASLNVDTSDGLQRWLIANIDGARIGVTRCQVDAEGCLCPDLDMVFAVTPEGWEPQELAHSEQVWQDYVCAMQAAGQPVANQQGDFQFASFTDYMALTIT